MKGKVFIENVEVTIEDKAPIVERSEHIIKNNKYVLKTLIKEEFASTIHCYNDLERIIVSKIRMFGSDYYRILFCNDQHEKAWTLIELPWELEVRIHRIKEDMFVISGDNKTDKDIMSQVSFCRLKASTKVEEFTTSFTKLNYMSFINKCVLVSSTDVCKMDGKIHSMVISYNSDGKRLETHYEYIEEKGKITETGSREFTKLEVEDILKIKDPANP